MNVMKNMEAIFLAAAFLAGVTSDASARQPTCTSARVSVPRYGRRPADGGGEGDGEAPERCRKGRTVICVRRRLRYNALMNA